MMLQRYAPILLLSVVTVALAQEEPCITTRAKCTEDQSYSSLTVINDNYYCCVVGYTMRWDNQTCFCNKTHAVEACLEGSDVCKNSTTSQGNSNDTHTAVTNNDNNDNDTQSSNTTTDSADDVVTMCCREGFNRQIFTGDVNGSLRTTCACTRWLDAGGFAVTIEHGETPRANYTSYRGHPSFQGKAIESLADDVFGALDAELENLIDDLFSGL